jgi:hypothetical protein
MSRAAARLLAHPGGSLPGAAADRLNGWADRPACGRRARGRAGARLGGATGWGGGGSRPSADIMTIFAEKSARVPPEVMASVGHASKQAMLDDDRVNMARNDLIDRIDRRQVVEREAGEVFAWWSEKVRAEYEERARFIEYARKRFAEEMYNHGASTGKPGSIMALEALVSRSPDGLTGGGSR